MRTRLGAVLLLGACLGAAGAGNAGNAAVTNPTARAGIEAFNRALSEATTHMDNAATIALWEADGVSLLPSTRPLVGRKAIAAFLDAVTARLPGARMAKFELRCADIETSGDWASEWCQEHQVVLLAPDKPPFDGQGVMLLVLHRGTDGKWRLKREMWSPAAAADQPAAAP